MGADEQVPVDAQLLLVAGMDIESGSLRVPHCILFCSFTSFFCANDCLATVFIFLPCLGRWYIREGWLLVVPSKGKELKRRMFFLFSDIFVATKPCHPLHLLNSNKFACTAVYPLHQCEVDKVFGHTQSQGGLLSVSILGSSIRGSGLQSKSLAVSAAAGLRRQVVTMVNAKSSSYLGDVGFFPLVWALLSTAYRQLLVPHRSREEGLIRL